MGARDRGRVGSHSAEGEARGQAGGRRVRACFQHNGIPSQTGEQTGQCSDIISSCGARAGKEVRDSLPREELVSMSFRGTYPERHRTRSETGPGQTRPASPTHVPPPARNCQEVDSRGEVRTELVSPALCQWGSGVQADMLGRGCGVHKEPLWWIKEALDM